jgi:hypothetical protein
MIEIRAYITSTDVVNKKLLELGCAIQGEYAFQDYIFQPKLIKNKFDLNKEFIRIRAYQKTNWVQKSIELVHKVKSTQGGVGVTKLKQEFDEIEEARIFLGSDYIQAFSFGRQGIEYKLETLRMFVENIESLPASIEIIAHSKEKINWLFDQIAPVKIVFDSVPKLIECNKNDLFTN